MAPKKRARAAAADWRAPLFAWRGALAFDAEARLLSWRGASYGEGSSAPVVPGVATRPRRPGLSASRV